MTPMKPFTYCPITGRPVDDVVYSPNYERYLYKIKLDGATPIPVSIPEDYKRWERDDEYVNNRHLVAGLLLNGKLFSIEEELGHYKHLTLDIVKRGLNEGHLPKTPQEKYDNLLSEIFALQEFDGDTVNLTISTSTDLFYKRLYFKTNQEFIFYMNTLKSDGYIWGEVGPSYVGKISITFKGLSHLAGLRQEGSQSRNCFVAMSFGDDMSTIRQAIKDACTETGYMPILIDETHYDSDATINDAIIANLKKSRFCIADFTEQKDGVYFESGYALGQGKQVIYSCRNDFFKASHFDTNHFPHIIYDTPQQLKEALINKINAWIR